MLLSMVLYERLAPLIDTVPNDVLPEWTIKGQVTARWLTVAGIATLLLWAIFEGRR